jgi:type IV pilus assembly protein PilV
VIRATRHPAGIRSRRSRARGFALLEVLVALVVATFGVLALATLQNRAITLEVEANQRAQALVLLQDIAERLSANRAGAAEYVGVDIGVGAIEICDAGAARSEVDLCEWGNLLRGAAATVADRGVGAMIGARGCIAQLAPSTFLIAIAWQGLMETAAPAADCGEGEYGNDTARRVVSTVTQFADLEAL